MGRKAVLEDWADAAVAVGAALRGRLQFLNVFAENLCSLSE